MSRLFAANAVVNGERSSIKTKQLESKSDTAYIHRMPAKIRIIMWLDSLDNWNGINLLNPATAAINATEQQCQFRTNIVAVAFPVHFCFIFREFYLAVCKHFYTGMLAV